VELETLRPRHLNNNGLVPKKRNPGSPHGTVRSDPRQDHAGIKNFATVEAVRRCVRRHCGSPAITGVHGEKSPNSPGALARHCCLAPLALGTVTGGGAPPLARRRHGRRLRARAHVAAHRPRQRRPPRLRPLRGLRRVRTATRSPHGRGSLARRGRPAAPLPCGPVAHAPPHAPVPPPDGPASAPHATPPPEARLPRTLSFSQGQPKAGPR